MYFTGSEYGEIVLLPPTYLGANVEGDCYIVSSGINSFLSVREIPQSDTFARWAKNGAHDFACDNGVFKILPCHNAVCFLAFKKYIYTERMSKNVWTLFLCFYGFIKYRGISENNIKY